MPVWEDSADSIHDHGHRDSVGGLWDEIGRLQLDFLVQQGLRPEDVVVDVACGSLRGGVHLIRYLKPGHYLGIDKKIELVIYGVGAELGLDTYREKRPRFVISDRFDFDRFERRPNFGIGQSIFTHLAPEDIILCLRKLRLQAADDCRFFASYRDVPSARENPPKSHAHEVFDYTRDEMAGFAAEGGWTFDYIGDWKHPRHLKMAAFSPRPAG